MTNQLFSYDAVLEACDYANLDEDAIRLSYSGRGMYGAQCFGIVGSDKELFLFCAGLADYVGYNDAAPGIPARDAVQGLIEHAATDSMGRDMILYFPGYTLDN